jgi:hypothetical protein
LARTKSHEKSEQWRQYDKGACRQQTGPDDRCEARLHDAGADQSADQRVRTARRNAAPPGNDVPGDSANQCAEDDVGVHDLRRDDSDADSSGDVNTENQEGNEIEERSPDYSIARSQHARRNQRRDRVCRVVQPVEKIKRQGHDNQADEQGQGEDIGHSWMSSASSELIDND